MKLCILGDTHLRSKTPKSRTESDFMEVCVGKLWQALRIFQKKDCDVILQPGDFFHSPDPSKRLVAGVIEYIRGAVLPHQFFVIHGQHDMTYHSAASMENSALRVMEAAEAINVVRQNDPIRLGGNVFLHGASFGQEPDKPVEGNFNILMSHVMVGDKPLWPGHDLTGPDAYARKYPGFDLYLFGDYHYGFTSRLRGGAKAINSGCLLRLTAGDRDMMHKPKVVIFDTDTMKAEDVYLDVSPVEKAFKVEEKKENDPHKFDEMASKLRQGGQIGTSFAENLQAYYREHETPEEIREMIATAV